MSQRAKYIILRIIHSIILLFLISPIICGLYNAAFGTEFFMGSKCYGISGFIATIICFAVMFRWGYIIMGCVILARIAVNLIAKAKSRQ